MGPIDYMSDYPQFDLAQKFTSGLRAGAAVGELQQQQQAIQLAQQQAQQYKADVAAAMANPTPQNFSALALKYPAQREAIKQSWDGLSAADQKQEGDTMAQAYSALLAGQPDAAKKVVEDQITARKNAGLDTSHYDNALALLNTDPKQAQGALGFALSHIADPKSFATQFGTLGGELRAQDKAPADLRKANADAGSAEADQTTKNLGIVGQKAGALAQVKGVKPAQAATMFQSLAAQGLIPKDDLPTYIAAIPTDPADVPAYLQQIQAQGMTPKDQMAYTTPTADAKLSSATQIKTTGMNNATQLAVQDKIGERQDSKGDTEPTLDANTLKIMATQYLAGDKTVMQNLGRGAQGAANIVALRKAITDEATAQGLTGPQIAAKMAEFAGTMAGQRTAGTRIANIEMASNEAESLLPLAREASAAVSRSGLLPFGKAQIMFDEQTNDPAMRRFAAANNALVNVYSRAISPSGVPTVADKEHARHLLSTAMDQQSYLAVLDQMERELAAARHAPQAVRSAFSAAVAGQQQPPAPAIPAGWSVQVH